MARLKRLPVDVRKRATQAKKRLGVKASEMVNVPRIEPSLRESGIDRDRVIEILEGDTSSDARQFLAKYRTISKSDRIYLTLEEMCVASGLSTRQLWEVISGARFQQSQDAIKLLVADSHPAVVRATIRAAEGKCIQVLPDGTRVWASPDVKAQELLYRATGFVPMPKGSRTIFNLNQPQTGLPVEVDDEVEDELLPDADDVYKTIAAMAYAPMQLEAPKETVPFVAEFEEVPLDVRR